MKNYHISFSCLIMATALILSSCSNEIEDSTIETVETMQRVPVNLSATLTPFDATQIFSSRSTTLTWKEGDVIYLQYTTADGSTTKGTATYHSGTWTATYDKPLKRDSTTDCKVYFFDGKHTASATEVAIEPTTGIYADLEATYNYPTGGTLSITCNLKPQTSRIRFKGIAGTAFELSGLSCGSSFTLASGSLSKSQPTTTVTIQANGYSPYIYGNFAYTSEPILVVTQDDYTFTAECKGLDMLTTGESGCMTLPTTSVHNGWEMKYFDKNKPEFTVKGVTFNMIKVEKGIFQMGSNEYSDEKPVHSVTISKDFYIGETEVTQALWKAVTGYSPTSSDSSWSSSYGVGDNYPAYFISYEDVQSFITKLNQMTGRQFRMPTEAEWEYAANGGKRSLGYTYSGSESIGDVAWYDVNSYDKGSSSPDYGTHPVKTKSPNELGIYDMSGNVWEWCSDWYGSYSNGAVTDPTGATSGSDRVLRGGSWSNSAVYCRTVNRKHYTPTYRYDYLGFRLAL